jgi:hypothetical protein
MYIRRGKISPQGCQIFVDIIYQHGENVPNDQTYTSSKYIIPNGYEIYQRFPFQGLQKIFTNWDFCFANIPSGNPG